LLLNLQFQIMFSTPEQSNAAATSLFNLDWEEEPESAPQETELAAPPIVTALQAEMGPRNEPLQKEHREKSNVKCLRQSGKQYVSPWSGKTVREKAVSFDRCNCRHGCNEKFSPETRVTMNKQYWSLGSWDAQSNFILSTVQCEEPKRCTIGNKSDSRIQNVRIYTLNGKRVCQKFYLRTLDINHMRVNYVLKKKAKFGMSSPDKRGGKPANKLDEEVYLQIETFLNKFPKYRSHYSSSQRFYFDSSLTVNKLHKIFCEQQKSKNLKIVSYSTFCREFKKYNIGIYIPKTDTCSRCDDTNMKLSTIQDPEERAEIEAAREAHHSRAELARETLRSTTAASKTDKSLLAFSYDLEQAQPIPYLSTNKAYYTRQLNLYNFGINVLGRDKAVICSWHEGEGKKGSFEVCSSLYEFLRAHDLQNVKKIHSFSDGCGGQNRNRNVINFMMWCCDVFGIEEWQHTYMESGHSFLPNDQNFGQIQKTKLRERNIYSFDEWMGVIAKSQIKNPFDVLKMGGKFLDLQQLTANCRFKPKSDDGEKFSFLDLKWICVRRGSEVLEYRYSNSAVESVKYMTIKRKQPFPNTLPINKRIILINGNKKKDLFSLFPYIPGCHLDFFRNLNFADDCNDEDHYID